MADRSVLVRLRADISDFQRKFTSAAATSTLLSRSLDRTAVSARGSDKEIDRLSGRLKLFRDAAILLGPTLGPLGAAIIPAVTGAIAGLGAAAGGLGVSILALKGVGDAIKAIDTYQLEPTAENLQAMRIEMEKLGPAGAHFAKFIDGIEGELRTLQLSARNGLLPGLEEGIDSALERLPKVRKVVRELAQGMGELAATAGDDLSPGGDWDAFFRYLDTDGKDTLVSFGQAIGDITNGLADMMVAFAPVNRDFTAGFEEMARSFADWAAGLDESEDFEEFLDYIRVNGPRAIDMLGTLAHTLGSIVKAAAPVGAVTLPILTKFLDAIGKLAASPLGTPFIVALGAITAYSRAVDLATASQARFAAAQKTGFASAGTAAVIAGLVVTLAEYVDMMDVAEEQTRIWDESLAAGTLTVDELKARLQEMKDSDTITGVGDLLKTAMDPTAWIKTSLPGFLLWKNEVEDTAGAATLAAQEIEILGAQTKQTGGLADLFARDIGQTADQLRVAAHGAEEFSGALAELNGWLDKRAALRGYREALGQLTKGLKDGFNREDRENIDATAESIAQVAASIKDKGIRADFLANARASLVETAENAAPKARAEIQKVINKLDELGLTHPEPTVDANTKPAEEKIAKAKRSFDIFAALSGDAQLDANAGGFYGVFDPAMSALNNFDGRTATAYLNVVRRGTGINAAEQGVGGNPNPRTSGRTSSRGGPFGDYMRGGDLYGKGAGILLHPALNGLHELKDALKKFSKQLDEATKAVDREKRKRNELIDASKAFASAVGGAYAVADPFSGGLTNFDAAVSANANDTNAAAAALAALEKKGLDGPLYQALAASGNLALLQEFAGLSAAQIDIKEQQFASQSAAQSGLGSGAAAHEFAAAIKEQTEELKEAQRERKKYAALVKEVQRRLDQLPDKVEDGARKGVRDRDRATAAQRRAG